MKSYIFLIVAMLGISNVWAKQYITGVQKVTFRIGPGIDNKIIAMMETGTGVKLIESGESWSKVKDSEGREGYIMNRFLTKDVPYELRYKWLAGQHKKLKEELAQVRDQQKDLNQDLSTAKRELASTKENLQSTASNYEQLKEGSSEYLALKQKYDAAKSTLSGLTTKVDMLQEKLSLYYFTWFLTGAGILLLGWMIGFFSKKRKKGYGGIQL